MEYAVAVKYINAALNLLPLSVTIVIKRPERPYLFIFLSFLFLEPDHRHRHGAYSFSIHKDYKLVYILHTTTATTETLYQIRQHVRSARSTPQSTSATELFTCLPTIHWRSFGPINPSARCHLSIAQICLQHPFHPSQLLGLHTHHGSKQPVADSQVKHLMREVALFTEIRKRRHNCTRKTHTQAYLSSAKFHG